MDIEKKAALVAEYSFEIDSEESVAEHLQKLVAFIHRQMAYALMPPSPFTTNSPIEMYRRREFEPDTEDLLLR